MSNNNIIQRKSKNILDKENERGLPYEQDKSREV